MPRITQEERERFHLYLDEAIDKMNRPKNAAKSHWSTLPIGSLQKMINTENSELEEAVYNFLCGIELPEGVESENYDIININMMMLDNLRNRD